MKKGFAIMLASLLIMSASACQSPQGKEQVILKVSGVHEVFFAPGYKDRFEEEYPHIDLEILPNEHIPNSDPVEELKLRIREQSPDIILTGTANFVGAAKEGLFLPLDPFVEKSGFSLDTMPPAVVHKLRQEGGGQLYGLVPEFSSAALFYNKALFQKYQVELPKDDMSWQEVFELAARFPKEAEDGSPFWGLLSPGQQEPEVKLYNLINWAGRAENLATADIENDVVTVNTPAWQNIWRTFMQAYRDGLISNVEYEDLHPTVEGLYEEERYAIFLNGHAAMVVGEHGLLNLALERETLEFGLATTPGKYQIYLQNSVFNISRESQHPEEAWTFLTFVLSEEMAKHKLGLTELAGWNQLPARISVLEQRLDRDLSAFYKQAAAHRGIYSQLVDLPVEYLVYEREATQEELALVLAEEKTIEQALADLQAKLETAWRDMR